MPNVGPLERGEMGCGCEERTSGKGEVDSRLER